MSERASCSADATAIGTGFQSRVLVCCCHVSKGASCCTCHCFRILDTLSWTYIGSGDMQMLLLLLLFPLLEPVHRSTVQLFDLSVNLGKLQWVVEKQGGGDSCVRVCVGLALCMWKWQRDFFCTVSLYCMLHKEHVSHMAGLRRTGSRFITECNPLQPFHQPLCIQRLHFKDLVQPSRVLLVTRQASTCKVHSAIIR